MEPNWFSLPIILAQIYLFTHLVLLIIAPRPPRRRALLIAADALMLALFSGLLLACPAQTMLENPALRFLRLWAPIVFFWWAYTWAGRILHVIHPPDRSWDPHLLRWEGRWLGQPSLKLAATPRPWITEVMHFFYAGYYLFTPVLGIALYLQGRWADFEAMTGAVAFGYAVSYTSFSLFPVWGPRWGLVEAGLVEPARQKLRGYWITSLMNRIMYGGPALKGGAMPSAHSSTAVVFLVWSERIWGLEGGLIALVAVTGMWVGSVYGRYHWVLDIVIGAGLGLVGVWTADAVRPWSP